MGSPHLRIVVLHEGLRTFTTRVAFDCSVSVCNVLGTLSLLVGIFHGDWLRGDCRRRLGPVRCELGWGEPTSLRILFLPSDSCLSNLLKNVGPGIQHCSAGKALHPKD